MNKDELSLLSDLGNIFEKGLRESLSIPEDWKYISTTLSSDQFQLIQQFVTEDNFVSVVATTFVGEVVRITAFLSPNLVSKLIEELNNA